MTTVPRNEIGRPLKAADLKPGTVVVVHPPGKPALLTLWVRYVDHDMVEFYSGVMKWHIVNFVQPDGSIHDDQGRKVQVYEYLGEV